MANYPIYRLVKGTTLTFTEMDGNLEWLSKNMSASVVTITGSTFLSGSLTVSSGITGSLFGTSSWAVSASWAPSIPISYYIATASITASVNTDPTASFKLTSGSNILLNITKDGYAWIGKTGSLGNQTYQLDVQGTGRFTTAANTYDFLVENTATSPYPATSITIASNATSNIGTATLNLKTGNGITYLTSYGGYSYLGFQFVTNAQTTNTSNRDILIQKNSDRPMQMAYNFPGASSPNTLIEDEWIYMRAYADSNTVKAFRLTATDGTTDKFVIYGDGSTNLSGSLSVNKSITASNALFTGTITAQTIVAQTITSSTEWITGSSKFGSLVTDTHQFTGSLLAASITGSLQGTSSWAVSASWAPMPSVNFTSSLIAVASITASVSTDLSSSLRVTSASNTLMTLTKDGQMWLGNGTFVNQGYQLDVQGTARFTSAANSINIYKQNTRNSLGVYGGSAPVGVELPSVLGSPNATGYLIADASYYVPIGMLAWNGVGVGIKNNVNASDITGSLSSIFTIASTTQGILLPRMTDTQRIAISAPAQGLQVYDIGSSTEGIWYYSSGSIKAWTRLLNNTGSQSITGSLTATQGFTGSLFGTSSWAVSASWAPGGSGTVTSVTVSAGSGLSGGGTVTTAGTITLTNAAPDQTVVLSNGTGISATGTYPNFTITNTAPDQVVTLSNGTGISVTGTYPSFTIASTVTDTNIYNSNGSLSGNRIVTGGGNSLTFDGTSAFIITGSTTNQVLKLSSAEPYLLIQAEGATNAASIFLRPSTSAQNGTIQNRSGGGLEFYVGATPSLATTIQSTGRINFANYTTTTSFTGTVVGFLGFDASGNILTTTGSGATGGASLSGGKTNYNTIWNSTTTVSTGSIFQYSATQIQITGSSLAVGDIAPSSTPGRIDASNDIVAFSTSDARFKDNVKPINNALQKVNSINGVEFDWIEDIDHHGNSGHDVGVIAQELERVLPEVVTTRDSGYKAVKYDKIVPLLIQAIKEQQSEINELKLRIDGLTK